jgi:hypothetical protein
VSSTPCDSAWISSLVSNQRPFNFNFIFLEIGRSHRVPNQGEYSGWGMTAILCLAGHCWVRTDVCCHGEATRSVLTKVRGAIFTCFHTVATKCRSRTQNSQFELLGPVLRATTTAV